MTLALAKRLSIWVGVVALGFVTKLGFVEAERMVSMHFVESCFDQTKPSTLQGESACYGAPREQTIYRILSALNAQPSFWKNTTGRCVGTQGTRADAYFECRWWNRLAI